MNKYFPVLILEGYFFPKILFDSSTRKRLRTVTHTQIANVFPYINFTSEGTFLSSAAKDNAKNLLLNTPYNKYGVKLIYIDSPTVTTSKPYLINWLTAKALQVNSKKFRSYNNKVEKEIFELQFGLIGSLIKVSSIEKTRKDIEGIQPNNFGLSAVKNYFISIN